MNTVFTSITMDGSHNLGGAEKGEESGEQVWRPANERAITGSATGSYNLDFIDWENEWEAVSTYTKVFRHISSL